MSFRNYRLQSTCLCKCLNCHVSVHPKTVNMLNGQKHCCNLHDSSYMNFFIIQGKFQSEKFVLIDI